MSERSFVADAAVWKMFGGMLEFTHFLSEETRLTPINKG